MKGRIISFAKTTEALNAGRKTKTRRYWKDKYAQSFKVGDLCQAWDLSPRTGKGKFQRMIRLTKAPYKQKTSLMTEQDFEDEGFAFMQEHGILIDGETLREFFENWKKADTEPWVVEFELVVC